MTPSHSPAYTFSIEAGAKRRLADEYDAAQERGEVRSDGDNYFKVSRIAWPDERVLEVLCEGTVEKVV